jgi:hypothetical protein
MLQETLGSEFDVCSDFKANVTRANVVENLGKLVKGHTKQDRIAIVGGPEEESQLLCREYKCGFCKPLQDSRQAVDEWNGYLRNPRFVNPPSLLTALLNPA